VADQADKLRALASQVRQAGAGAATLAGGRTSNGLKKALAQAAPKPLKNPFGRARARVITVSSGKGGVGKTNLSVNLALSLRKLGKEVILFDADLGLANADILLGMSTRHNLQHFFQGKKSLQEIMSEGPLGLKVIASGNGIAQMANLNGQDRERMLSHFSLIEEKADVIVVDTGAGISKNVLSFAMAADECLIVTTPEPTARLDAYGLIKVLNQEGFEGVTRLVVNMTEDSNEGQEVGKLMETLATRFLHARVEYLGCVPRDKNVLKAVRMQEPFILAFPDCAASKAVSNLASRLVELPEPPQGVGGGFRAFFERVGSMIKMQN
jgi:flagellar biosynthesis protein FlhG